MSQNAGIQKYIKTLEEYDSSPFPELSDSEYAEFIKISETMLSEISEKQFQRYKELVRKILFLPIEST